MEVPTLTNIQDRPEDTLGFNVREAQPIDGSFGRDKCATMKVTDDAITVYGVISIHCHIVTHPTGFAFCSIIVSIEG